MSYEVGDIVEGFSLPEAPGVVVDVPLGATPVVIFFFPLAFSPVCTEGFCSISKDWSMWSDCGCSVYGISVDSPFVVNKFKEELDLPFPILSDFNKEISSLWGAFHEDLLGMRGVAKRSAFVVDANSKLVYKDIKDDPGNQLDFEEILKFANQVADANG